MTVRESPNEFDHVAKERWGADWYAFCQALYKRIAGEDWEELYDAYKEMSRAVEVKKQQEAQKAKALWKMKAAKEAGEEYDDPKRDDTTSDEETRQDGHFGKNTSKIQLVRWTKP